MRTGEVHVGTSGWTYEAWKDTFYAGVPRRRWLEHYAGRFDAVEVNATFYHALRPATFAHWHAATPAHFRFALKGHRWITHVERLAVPDASIDAERDRACGLAEKLAAVLWQLPGRLAFDPGRLERFVRQLARWPGPRHALEFRNPGWFRPEVAELLAAHGVAVVQSDAADWPLWDAVTTDLVYVRLHGHTETYRSAYTEAELQGLAVAIGRWRSEARSVYAFFDNTDGCHAPPDAMRLRAMTS
jgi:uncharacterized protein YecE (DUF72 family)